MEPPFHKGKMANAAAKLRNNKSCGKDGLYAELLKHVPEEAQKQIENKLNHMRLTGECENFPCAKVVGPTFKYFS